MELAVSVPSLLRDCTGGKSHFTLEADTLDHAMKRLLADYPLLNHHIFDEAGKLRQHVLIYYNEDNIEWLEHRQIPLQVGDKLMVLQAVSGG
ncbi:MoaD/ThiS family protein [Paenibacillus agricola]|uniref:MoaD/ThiS family protein n=1 Tax=Paenibacillus agricola TaxID=2716264 RepID=A0ABX0IYA7_9BACL|nr:MoaD/ThiS family protein [Paenibacillus agricola]NHN28210.1 MoaD/ThiS family protein [Paenibacillus agricola]